jgi:hypothetical protein
MIFTLLFNLIAGILALIGLATVIFLYLLWRECGG